ncbi:MAG: TatD family hydrolase [Mycoplasmoidaceae bacterium]
MLYDTHAHLNLEYSDEELNLIIKKSIEQEIYVNIVGVDLKSSIRAIEIARLNPKYFFAVIGIHPNDASKLTKEEIDNDLKQLDDLIENNLDCIKAIGETGLDYFREKDKKGILMQFYSFEKHIELARKYNLPLVLHIREAHDDAIKFITERKLSNVLIHCFSDKLAYAQQYVKLGCKLSFPGIITFKKSFELREVVSKIDINNIVLETDCPYLTPEPFRGKKNSPIYIESIFQEVSKIKNISYNETCEKICANSLLFFNI